MNWFSMNPSKEASFTLPPPPPPLSPSATKFESKISPSILLIIVILAVIFFISGILHLLVRFLLRTTVREPEESVNGTALQGQLQELFHLHDAGVDQSFIDTLPIFLYKAIIGLKDPFDCAVCLCEFEPEDKLRLLPKCSHAFHIECIDTWLLSHSTCPVCRRSLFPDFSPAHSPMVLVLESGNGSPTATFPTATFPTATFGSNRDDNGLNSRLSSSDSWRKSAEVDVKEEVFRLPEEKIVAVKLGNFRNVDVVREGEGEGSNNGNLNADLGASQRRCFSMGSYEYVMDESCVLRVAINTAKKKRKKKMDNVKMRGYKAMSECSCHPSKERIRDDFKVPELKLNPKNGTSSSSSTLKKGESFSVSKIWLQPRKDMAVDGDPARRAFSFRFPIHRAPGEELKTNHIEFGENWEKNGSEVDLDVEVGSCAESFGSEIGQTPSFARRTLMWIVGKPNRVGSNQLN